MQVELKDILAVLGDKVVQIALLEGQLSTLQTQIQTLSTELDQLKHPPLDKV